MSASGVFSMEPTTGARISVVPVTLTPELLRTLEEMIKLGGGAAVQFDTKGRGGQFIVAGHQAADFSLSQAKAPLPSILKEIGQRVEVVSPVSTAITVDSYRKGAVDGSESRNLKRKFLDSKAERRTSANSSVTHCKMNVKDITRKTSEDKSKKKSVETTTPESGYGTDLSTRLGEFEEEEKVQDADELSEGTPYIPKRRRDDLPAPLLRGKPGHIPSSRSQAPPPASSSKENAKMSISIPRKRLMCYPNVDTSFLTKYPPLQNERDRKGYEVMYKKCYHENYIPLYNKLEQRANEWRRLDACLHDTSNDAVDIKAKMEKISRESQADMDVPKWKYLHEKLAHIKRMGAEWDSKQVPA
jgi:hypothetical protein